ncbi:MAG: glycosyltransferase family 39 protein [Fimbriimonadaceae bacterium]|nr:glycosyltransferase family 39 protein [Fimbriimonadaceae bacterium]
MARTVPDSPATAAARVETGRETLPNAASPARWRPSGERVLFALLLVAAAIVRFAGPGLLEPNVSTAEAAHIAGIERLLADPNVGLFSSTGMGTSGLALVPAAALRIVRPEPELALRLYVGLGSLAFVALFYALCRTHFGPVVSLTTTGLLAFSPWSVTFGRNGDLSVFAAAWAAAAALCLQRALRGGGPRRWLLAGAATTAGLYWHPSAIWLLPTLALPVLWLAVERSQARPRLIVAFCVLAAAGALVAVPRIPALTSQPISTTALLTSEGAAPPPDADLRMRAQQTARAFFLLDATVNADGRYLALGRAPLDALSGLLLLSGLILAAWRLPTRVLPLSLALVPLLASQLASPRVPALADATVALPGLYLLVAEALARLVAVLPFPSVTRAALLVAVPAYAIFGWGAYTDWIGSAASAQARQPALDYDEVDAFVGQQRTLIAAGQPIGTVRAWRADHPRLATGSRVIRRPRNTPGLPAQADLSQLNLRPAGQTGGPTGDRAARGAVANRAGEVFVTDAVGRVSRLDPERNSLVPLPGRPPPLEQVSDLAADADGFLYLADAERSLLVKLSPTGEQMGTIGAEWGMYRPRGLSIGPDGRIYVADTGRNRIAVGTVEGRFVKAIPPPASFGPFEQPTAVVVDPSGRIYVGLPEIGRLAVLDDSGQVLGGWTTPKGNTIESSRLAVVADGAVAVTEPAQAKVRLLDADGRELSAIDAPGRPYGVAVAGGRLFVAEPASGRVLIFSLGGR